MSRRRCIAAPFAADDRGRITRADNGFDRFMDFSLPVPERFGSELLGFKQRESGQGGIEQQEQPEESGERLPGHADAKYQHLRFTAY